MKILTAEQVRKADYCTINKYGIPGIVLMERAGRAVAGQVLHDIKQLKLKRHRTKVSVFCGKGNNGGDGLACARYLSSAGLAVQVCLLCNIKELRGDAFYNILALNKRKTKLREITGIKEINLLKRSFKADIIIDAIFGTGFYGKPGLFYEEVMKMISSSSVYTVSIDVPSGLDATTGMVEGAAVVADLTVTIGFAKTGFYKNKGPFYCGAIKVADIGLRR